MSAGTSLKNSVRWLALALAVVPALAPAGEEKIVDIASRRQLFVDEHLIAAKKGVRLVMHLPTRREIVLRPDHPWEALGISYLVTFKDGDRFRAWYRCDAAPFDRPGSVTTGYADSKDGIRWVKPMVRKIAFHGSKDNNLVWAGPGENMAPFRDDNAAASPQERYKAIVRSRDSKIFALVSPDGLDWRLLDPKPILTDGPFDSFNIAYWDHSAKQYVAYVRGVRSEGKLGHGMSADDPFYRTYKGVRWIRRTTSKDFRRWAPLRPIDTGPAPLEHLYTNSAVPYDRAPGLVLMFPSRFADAREPKPGWPGGKGVNDIVLLASRDGLHFDRGFMEAFVRPGLDAGNWHERAMFLERGILATSPTEMSLYLTENWKLKTVHVRRLTLRPDGFVSLQARYAGGAMVTRPIRFAGTTLHLNFSTSAVGSVQVEIQDRQGVPIREFSLAQAELLCGDELDRAVAWKGQSDLSRLLGTTIRLRFVLRDADLYSFRFGS